NRDGDGKFRQPRAAERQQLAAVWRISGGGADHEQELPSERVEVPSVVVGIALRLPTEAPRQEIEHARKNQREWQAAPQKQQQQGKHAQKDHVDRQDVEELGLVLQQEKLDDRDLRLVDEIVDAEVLSIVLVLQPQHRVTDACGQRHECQNVCDVELPHPVVDPTGGGDASLPLESLAVDRRSDVAGNEDEYLGGVGECDRV